MMSSRMSVANVGICLPCTVVSYVVWTEDPDTLSQSLPRAKRRGSLVRDDTDHEQVSGPLGRGRVHDFVAPFSVITTFAVDVPSYVITSRRVSVTAAVVPY